VYARICISGAYTPARIHGVQGHRNLTALQPAAGGPAGPPVPRAACVRAVCVCVCVCARARARACARACVRVRVRVRVRVPAHARARVADRRPPRQTAHPCPAAHRARASTSGSTRWHRVRFRVPDTDYPPMLEMSTAEYIAVEKESVAVSCRRRDPHAVP
jgi:hypothetical protein